MEPKEARSVAMPTTEIQRDFTVADDLTPYRGSWVAIREGRVVASAVDPVELRGNPDVREDDWLLLVPSELDGVFLL
jgi:hypothetical protein